MKVQKLNNNKAVIIIDSDELYKNNITINDIKEGKEKVKDFFFNILESSDELDNFQIENSQLLIEVSSTNNNVFMITITKADSIFDSETVKKYNETKTIVYTVSSNLYEFNSILDLYNFSKRAVVEKLYLGTNTLYNINNKYYLFFSATTIKNENFVKTFSVISEYASKYYCKKLMAITEYAKPIILKKALQELQKI